MFGNIKNVPNCIIGDVVWFAPLLDRQWVDLFEDTLDLFEEGNESFAGVFALDQGIAFEVSFALETNFGVSEVKSFLDIFSTLHV